MSLIDPVDEVMYTGYYKDGHSIKLCQFYDQLSNGDNDVHQTPRESSYVTDN
ncbi:hypothetical protein H4R33_007005, partial [Dimargaris cristalligena]